MPDWTYQPLRGIAGALLGVRRSRLAALGVLAWTGSLPGGGKAIARLLGHRHPPAHVAGTVGGVAVRSRLGAVVPPEVARQAVRALPPLGAGLIVVEPVSLADVPLVLAAAGRRGCAPEREAAARGRVPVMVRTGDSAVARAVEPYVDAVLPVDGPEVVCRESASVAEAVRELAEPGKVVLATPALLIEAGPGWFGRVMEAATPTAPAPTPVGGDPRQWPAWWWGLMTGVIMAVAGLVAAAVALGPVLLWYDRAFLDMDRHALHATNHHLVHFLRHDRITLAGTMVAIGVLYAGLAAGGMRRGWPWAREAYLVSGWIGFAAVLYLFAHGYAEPLHLVLTAVLLPMFVAASRRSPDGPRWTARPDGPERERRRALTGQLLMVVTGIGLFAGGVAVSAVGLTDVFVAGDVAYLGAGADDLDAVNERLMPFIAHDRAGLGGGLMAAAAAITALSAWGWRRGEAWVWWTLAPAAAAGFVPAVVTHLSIGYVDLWHLSPVFLGMALTGTALALARPYLCGVGESPICPRPAARTPTLMASLAVGGTFRTLRGGSPDDRHSHAPERPRRTGRGNHRGDPSAL
ncbi:hypothetical protein SAMN05444920_11185 [Nonomuraea solani]|uniref:Uncharacterized protein n=1 Tax=Nonomuraea solani TaxID=1144553 RepID=A0A1H6ELS5_9ACTN|nr:hypothetical protein [Nonomuraea solani]SEG97845.1 hypothetical protein SAMN05444920_11185 [Nonomuraea solani]